MVSEDAAHYSDGESLRLSMLRILMHVAHHEEDADASHQVQYAADNDDEEGGQAAVGG